MTKSVSLVVALITLSLLLPPRVLMAQAPPAIPQAFYGLVEVDGQPAPVGTQIEARAEGVRTDVTGNPLQVSTAGTYGGGAVFDEKLIVQGTLSTGAAISFYVNGLLAECASPGGAWQSGWPFEPGDVTELNLRAFSTEQPTAAPSPTATSIPATATSIPATATSIPVTATSVPATATTQPTATPPPTGTVAPLTATAPPAATAQPTAQHSTVAAAPTATPTDPVASPVIPATAEPLTTLPPPPTQQAGPPVETTSESYPEAAASPTVASSPDAPGTITPPPVETAMALPTVAVDTTIAALIQVATPAPAPEPTGRGGLWFILVFVGIAVAAVALIFMGGKRPPEDADRETGN